MLYERRTKMAYEKLFEKGQIGSMKLKNRLVMPAMGCSMAENNGDANEHIIKYYEDRAKGGIGLIITEITRVDNETGIGTPNQLGATDLHHIPHMQRLADRIHKHGSKILIQLQHPGRQNKSSMIGGRQIIAPSAVMCKVTNEMPREMTTEECQKLVGDFVKGAAICQKAGVDGVEIHAAHGYLICEFLSPYTNHRTDMYGGSFENRFRILKEIVLGIRQVCGRDFVISVRISADEFVDGGLKLDDTVKISQELEKLGVDCINVSSGIYESATTIIEPSSFPQGWKKHLGKTIKANVSIPVIATNNIKDPDVAEALMEEDVCDFVAIGRASLADPEWGNKAKTDPASINKCIGCLYCFWALAEGDHIGCAVNPKCGREVEYASLEKDGNGRRVAVIGGGPAGINAALTLKERGFEPVIFEKESRLGGQLNIADKPILKEKMTAYVDSMIHNVEKAGIEVQYGKEATVEDIKNIQPCAVMVATGGLPLIPHIPGIDGKNVITAEDYLMGRKEVTGDVVVIGGGVTGMETAETIAARGNKATLVEMTGAIGRGLYRSVIADFMMRFAKVGVQVMTDEKCVNIGETSVTLENGKTKEETVLKADTVVLALGVKSNNSMVDALEKEFENVIVLGDADVPGRIAEAAFDGMSRAAAL